MSDALFAIVMLIATLSIASSICSIVVASKSIIMDSKKRDEED